MTIVLPAYRRPTATELQDQDRVRMEQIAELEKVFETARQALFSAIQTETATKGEIIRLNRAVEEADIAIQAARFPLRDVYVYKSIPIRQILLDETDERRLFDVAAFISRTHTLQDIYVREGEAPLTDEAAIAKELRRVEREERRRYRDAGILFIKGPEKADAGFMSMDWPVMITIGGTSYLSANHALLGELAKSLNDTAMFDRIRTSTEPNKIGYAFGDTAGVTEEQWNIQRSKLLQAVLREKFKQHPELAERLVQTGQKVLAADVTGDMLFGIGLDMDDERAMKPRKWTGQNMIGKTLEMIRAGIVLRRESTGAGVVQSLRAGVGAGAGAVTEAVDAVSGAVAGAVDAVEGVFEDATSALGTTFAGASAAAPAPAPAPAPPAPKKVRKLRIVSDA
jgi:ribA/ribD-fused uncharacterized protein